jgi:hypothetical protein
MFLGHFGVGLAAKKLTPYTSLGTLLLAAQLLDLIWPVLVLRGVEQVRIQPGITALNPLDFVSYPWSHSLVMAAAWALAFAALYVFVRRYPRGAMVAGAVVMSHWVLDLVSHRPDLPLFPGGGPLVGLGLWHSIPATLVVELVLLGVGLYLYSANTEPVDGIGIWALRLFAVALVGIYLASVFGPPPPDDRIVAYSALAMWPLVGWGYFIDRHRVAIRQW